MSKNYTCLLRVCGLGGEGRKEGRKEGRQLLPNSNEPWTLMKIYKEWAVDLTMGRGVSLSLAALGEKCGLNRDK
jgi:hypothetical protein